MKNRIKTFYKDHNHIILPVTVFVATFASFAYSISKIVDGKDITNVTRRVESDGRMSVRVVQKNGVRSYYDWNPDLV